MSRLKRTAIIALVPCIGLLQACALCGEDQLKQLPSPDKSTTAFLLLRNCGATTDFVTHINLAPSEASLTPHWSGEITAGEVFVAAGRVEVDLTWVGNDRLVVRLPGAEARATKRLSRWESQGKKIDIDYRRAAEGETRPR